MSPLISVILPVFNEDAALMSRAVESILSQTFSGFELLLLDDGSTDPGTLSCLEDWKARDSRIQVHKLAHQGLISTLNYGLRIGRGRFFCRQDADDWSDPSRFQVQVSSLLDRPELGLTGTGVVFHRESGESLWGRTFPTDHERILAQFRAGANPFCHGSVMFRSSLVGSVGVYRESLRSVEDLEFFWRMCCHTRAINVPELLYHYRYRRCSISSEFAIEQTLNRTRVRQAILRGDPDLLLDGSPPALDLSSQAMEEVVIRGKLQAADRVMLAGYYRSALATYLHAVRPFSGLAWTKLLRSFCYLALPPLRPFLFHD